MPAIYTAHWTTSAKGTLSTATVIYNGAKDNAAGTGAMLEIARAFTTLKPAPPRTILFLR